MLSCPAGICAQPLRASGASPTSEVAPSRRRRTPSESPKTGDSTAKVRVFRRDAGRRSIGIPAWPPVLADEPSLRYVHYEGSVVQVDRSSPPGTRHGGLSLTGTSSARRPGNLFGFETLDWYDKS